MVFQRIESNFTLFPSFVLDIEVHSLILISLYFLFLQGLFLLKNLQRLQIIHYKLLQVNKNLLFAVHQQWKLHFFYNCRQIASKIRNTVKVRKFQNEYIKLSHCPKYLGQNFSNFFVYILGNATTS